MCLDRVFCNKEWEDIFSDYRLTALSSSLSDHCPIFLCKHSQPHRMATFRFESIWARAPGFTEVVQEAWDMPVRGTSPMMIFHNRLENTRNALKIWRKELFSGARLQLQMANAVIKRLDKAQETRLLSQAEFELHKELKQQILGWAAIERSRRRQSSRIINLKEGDACTKYFHHKAKGHRKRNLITVLKRDNGDLVWEHEEKEKIIHMHFNDIIGTRIGRRCTLDWESLDLSVIDGSTLDHPFTLDEIKLTIDELPTEKAPGSDGFTGIFYKSCWDIIKQDLLAALQCFYNLRAGPLEKLNGANIVLIPKTDLAQHPRDFRLISLINSFAKLVTKSLAIRLSPHISNLVSNPQSAFVKWRCIHDNFLFVHRTKTPALLFKLDISKAFDTISWEYMVELLEQRGFSSRWRDWLSLLFRTSHSTILMNGTAGKRIVHARGLRQGDPLSPYLFILAIDSLQRILEVATMNGTLSPLRGRNAKTSVVPLCL